MSVIDDDESVRGSLPDLLVALGFATHAFASAEEFLESDLVAKTTVLIVDIVMPGMSGPALQRELKRRQQRIPIIFVTSRTKEGCRSHLLDQGAVECLFKPFSATALQAALQAALKPS